MPETEWRRDPRGLRELTVAPRWRPPRWAVLAGAFALGLAVMAVVLLAAGAFASDDGRADAVQSAYDRGLRDGTEAARATVGREIREANAEGYLQGLADASRFAARAELAPFTLSPFLAFAVPLDNLDRDFLLSCPADVPPWFLQLHGVDGCADEPATGLR